MDIFLAIVSAFAAIASAVAAFFSFLNSKKSNYIQVELLLVDFLSKSRSTYVEGLNKFDNEDISELEFKVYIEQFLNAYNEACSKYLQKAIGKKWFNSVYEDEIRKLISEDTMIKSVYNNEILQFPSIRTYSDKVIVKRVK